MIFLFSLLFSLLATVFLLTLLGTVLSPMSDNAYLRLCRGGSTPHPLLSSRYLTQCIDTFDPRTFTPIPSFTQTFMQLCLGLPEDLQKELFPTLLTPTKRSSSPIIYLESFPLVTSSDQLCHEFKRIFDYLPESSKLIFSQPSLIFCCSTFSNIQKSHFLELFLSKIPITEEI